MKSFRAIVIDPEKQTIEMVETTGSHTETLALVGASGLDHFRIAEHPTSFDYGWVDDTGLTGGKPVHAFLFDIRSKEPIAGRCVFIGVDNETGKTIDARTPVEFLREHIEWLGPILPEVFWEHTDTGARAIVTYARVKQGR